MSLRRNAVRAALAAAAVAVAAGTAPAISRADVDPTSCTQGIGYNTAIPTWEQFFAANPDPDAVLPFGAGAARPGGGAPANASGAPNPTGRNLNAVLIKYWDGLVALTANNGALPYQVIKKPLGFSSNGRPINFYVVGTRAHIANLDAPGGDAEFWRGVREGTISTDAGLEAVGSRPAFAWATATPHGDESAAGESITRELYELLARTDCDNARRMQNMDLFLMPVRNPDGHDAVTRTTGWGFDPNRDFGTQNQPENHLFVPVMNLYPGVFFIDAHQQGGSAYFFPPNEDPVHHEISQFSLDLIQKTIGPALQNVFNDQTDFYQNYNEYDLFTPEYGDTVPSLLMGAAGMTYEKGNGQIYARQIYDHYLAIDTTINVTADHKADILSGWVKQWGEAIQQGQNCEMQKNSLVSPLHDTIANMVPTGKQLCGFFFRPDSHLGDTASLITLLQSTGVRVWRLDSPANVNGLHEFGKATATTPQTLPAGTLWIPLAQGTKHWIEALLEENPFIPYNYFYDVVTWSYPIQRGIAGSGFLADQLPAGVPMTEIHGTSFGTAPTTAAPVYAFNTDSMQGIGLAADLLAKGVNVYRGKIPFTAGGKQFYSGAAMADGASLAQAQLSLTDLANLASARQTPVTALPGYPVAHYQLAVPKIGIYTNAATTPSDPIYKTGTGVNGTSGHCALSGNSASNFCEALFTLAVKDKIPLSEISPVTSTELGNGRLRNENFTAFIANPNNGTALNVGTAGALNAAGTALQDFINHGGVYIGINANGASPSRTIGASTLDTATISNLLTPGSTFDADFDITNPVAWGFDLGGWIYRDASGNAVFDGNTVGAGKVVEAYSAGTATNPGKYGYQVNAAGLASRPAIVDTAYGSGHTVLMGFDPFYRAWKEEDERLVLNAAMYPISAELPASQPTAETDVRAATFAQVQAARAPLAKAKLTTVPKAGVKVVANADLDVRISVKPADAAKLRAAVKAAKLSKHVRKRMHFKATKKSLTVVFKGLRTKDEHARRPWVSRIQHGMERRKVVPLYALI